MPIGRATSGDHRPRPRLEAHSRPKPAKLATNLALRERVEDDLERRYSLEQISGRLRRHRCSEPDEVAVAQAAVAEDPLAV